MGPRGISLASQPPSTATLKGSTLRAVTGRRQRSIIPRGGFGPSKALAGKVKRPLPTRAVRLHVSSRAGAKAGVTPPPRQKLNRQPNNQDLSMLVTRDCN